MILATGNISQRGLGLIQNRNFEMGTFIEKISIDDRLFLDNFNKGKFEKVIKLGKKFLKKNNDLLKYGNANFFSNFFMNF